MNSIATRIFRTSVTRQSQTSSRLPRYSFPHRSTMSTQSNSPASTRTVNIQMTSDAICPFCIIGLRHLQSAIKSSKAAGWKLDFNIRFLPFLLDPTLGAEPSSKRQRYEEKFGKERFEAMEVQMKARGKAVGVNFDYNGPVAQTTQYHRVMAKAYQKGGQDLQLPLAERLFLGYFEAQQNPGDTTWLGKEAVSVGVFANEQEAAEFFRSDECVDEVKRGYTQARQRGISGVPFFVFDDKYAMSGAQPPEAFSDLFEQLVEEGGAKGKEVQTAGPTC